MEKFWTKILPTIPKELLLIRRGNLYPFSLFTSDYNPDFKLNENLFIASWSEEAFNMPKEMQRIRDKLLRPERERRASFGKTLDKDTLCRLVRIEVKSSAEREKVYLHFQKTNYEDHYITNLNLDNAVLGLKTTIREKYAPNIEDIVNLKNSKLANPLGTSIFIVNTEKMKGVIGIRSKLVARRRGFFAVAGGHIVADDYIDFENGKPNPFLGAAREATNEFNGLVEKANLRCLGIGVDLIYGHPNILFTALINYDTKEIIEYPRKEKDEFSDFFEVNLAKPEELFKYLDPKRMSPNNAACIILSVEKLLPEIYCKKSASGKKYFPWKEDIFKTDYDIEIKVKKNSGKSMLVVNNELEKVVELSEQQTSMFCLMAKRLIADSKKKDSGLGYVSLKDFNAKVWANAFNPIEYPQIVNQLMKIKKKLDQKGYSGSGLIETIKGTKPRCYRLSTLPNRVTITN